MSFTSIEDVKGLMNRLEKIINLLPHLQINLTLNYRKS